jgi:hypothetical protein
MISELVAYVEFDRTQAQHAHWLSTSIAEHGALNTFYSDVVDAIDAVVENYISVFGAFNFTECDDKPVKDIKKHIEERADYIEANRDIISNGSASVGALLDDLTTVYTHAGYMLRMK